MGSSAWVNVPQCEWGCMIWLRVSHSRWLVIRPTLFVFWLSHKLLDHISVLSSVSHFRHEHTVHRRVHIFITSLWLASLPFSPIPIVVKHFLIQNFFWFIITWLVFLGLATECLAHLVEWGHKCDSNTPWSSVVQPPTSIEELRAVSRDHFVWLSWL